MQESRRFSMFSKVSTADVISNSPSLRLSALCHLARGGGLLQGWLTRCLWTWSRRNDVPKKFPPES